MYTKNTLKNITKKLFVIKETLQEILEQTYPLITTLIIHNSYTVAATVSCNLSKFKSNKTS